MLLEAIPGTKFLKPVANVLGDATKYFFKYGDDLLGLVKVNNVVKFTDDAVLKLAEKATKNATKTRVMLGKTSAGGVSYITEAGENFTYFYLDEWNDIARLVNNDYQSMWEINKQFLDDMFNKNKEFWFSHDPTDGSPFLTDFFADEVSHIKQLNGFVEFEKVGDYWRAVFN